MTWAAAHFWSFLAVGRSVPILWASLALVACDGLQPLLVGRVNAHLPTAIPDELQVSLRRRHIPRQLPLGRGDEGLGLDDSAVVGLHLQLQGTVFVLDLAELFEVLLGDLEKDAVDGLWPVARRKPLQLLNVPHASLVIEHQPPSRNFASLRRGSYQTLELRKKTRRKERALLK